VCGALYDLLYCSKCETFKEPDGFYFYKNGKSAGHKYSYCKACSNKRLGDYRDKQTTEMRIAKQQVTFANRRSERADDLDTWKEFMAKVPFRALTEQEWLEACSLFKGCAICGSETIELRMLFLNADNGGRYTPWNVFPSCSSCGTTYQKERNPFLRMDHWVHGKFHGAGMNAERQRKLLAYLVGRATKEGVTW
jgi:hypothetical protein